MNLCNIRYVDMGFPSGTLWGDRNMGADIIEAYGKHFNRENVTPEQLSKFTHRVPTKEQVQELIDNTTVMWTKHWKSNGVALISKINANMIFFPTTDSCGMYVSDESLTDNNQKFLGFNEKQDEVNFDDSCTKFFVRCVARIQ